MTQAAQAAFHRRQITQEAESITAGTVQRHQREADEAAHQEPQRNASHRTGLIDAHSLLNRLDG